MTPRRRRCSICCRLLTVSGFISSIGIQNLGFRPPRLVAPKNVENNRVRHYRTYSTLYGIAGLEVLTISLARSVSAAIRSNTDNITHDTATHRYTNINHYLSSATTGFIYPCGE
ncbi:hypothetical protein T4A_5196 [Trichinella pseudospiralis]|uniref:Uncharacterized protein n=1 Tax=Trichinella pseudospiralis TaxID=6337 RepID=A0A0V1ECT1_TRIPS|nr:hypothetical protein T4A_5196 [Trichinella pseudospiralis]